MVRAIYIYMSVILNCYFDPCAEDGSESLSVITSHEPIESDDTDQDKHLLSPSTAGDVTTVKESPR